MRVHVISDVHGRAAALRGAASGADALFCLGDLLLFVDYADEAQGIFAELFGNAGDNGDVMDLVDVRGHAAWTKIADAGGVQFQGNNSSSR